ncbi:hypothetical protein [Dechloromonas denitrificans]|uniref:hypothetical protein n=1 Tax=Dechloromonas denitrificans TaxID=281362 RepID=UPI000A580399|nr:hypothetical protein [Dechloromonas denitrificans]
MNRNVPRKALAITVLIATLSLNACAGLFGLGSDSWQEEVLLHDGQKIIVERSQTYGGQHEIGQSSPVREHTIRFQLLQSAQTVTWKSDYGPELGRTNFNVLALHIQDDSPYLVAEPNLCLAYNKWGRPNPPYVVFKYTGGSWQRINLAELPTEFKHINLIVNNGLTDAIERAARDKGYVSAERVESFNHSLTQPEYKAILRQGVENPEGSSCIKSDFYGKAGWLSPDWFTRQPSLEACLQFCGRREIEADICPCKTIFLRK